jgi:hypothetical protein
VTDVTTLDLPAVEALLTAYDLGTCTRYWPAAKGTENSNYFCATVRHGVEQQWVITVLEQAPSAGDGFVGPAMICPRPPGRSGGRQQEQGKQPPGI